jgi:hypothetical protein
MGTTRRIRAASALVSVLMLLGAAPAAAATVSREPYAWSDSGSYQCGDGSWIDWQAAGSGVLTVRQGKHGPSVTQDRFEWAAVDTRRSDGVSLYTTGHATSISSDARPLGGSVFELTSVLAGQPRVVRDAAGNLLARERGSVRTTILLDTLGDDDPENDVVLDESVRVNGPHSDAEICDLFE